MTTGQVVPEIKPKSKNGGSISSRRSRHYANRKKRGRRTRGSPEVRTIVINDHEQRPPLTCGTGIENGEHNHLTRLAGGAILCSRIGELTTEGKTCAHCPLR